MFLVVCYHICSNLIRINSLIYIDDLVLDRAFQNENLTYKQTQRLVQTEQQVKALKEEMLAIQKEREMEKEENEKKIEEMRTRHGEISKRYPNRRPACSCTR